MIFLVQVITHLMISSIWQTGAKAGDKYSMYMVRVFTLAALGASIVGASEIGVNIHLSGYKQNDSLVLNAFGADLVSQCAILCIDDWKCESFSYSSLWRSCLLSRSVSSEDWVPDTDYDSCLKQDISLSEALWPICELTTCGVEEMCLSDRRKTTCICDGYSEDGSVCMKKGSAEPEWNDWSEWTSCTKSCSLGVQSRARECSTGYVQDCRGNHMEFQQCQIQECPVWTAWSEWSGCSALATCGSGSQRRNRTCLHNAESTDSANSTVRLCPGPPEQIKFCETISCTGPVALFGDEFASGSLQIYDDQRGVWGSVCSAGFDLIDANIACHQMGFGDAYSVNTLNLTSNTTMTSSMNCTGDEYTIQSCQHAAWSEDSDCDTGVASVQCAVDGIWSLWAEWQSCSEWCGNGTQIRLRECNSPPAMWGGQQCPDSDTDTRPCFERHCPVDGEWQPWVEWSSCSLSCGAGIRTRDRQCMTPLHGGDHCDGDNQESEECNTHACPNDGVWMDWSPWVDCSVTCGGGLQTRERLCDGPYFGGQDCMGEEMDNRTCNNFYCPVDGVWQDWSGWSNCSVTCAGGVMFKYRQCEGPFYNGSDCNGPNIANGTCNDFPCPVPGDWNQWTSWSVCNTSCGGGYQLRNRECEIGLHGGANCTGADSEIQECNLHHCPVNGIWQAWSEWYSCSVSCGGGEKLRNRTCDGPYYEGLDCNGTDTDSMICNNQSCPIDGLWASWQDWGTCNATCGGGSQSRYRSCDGPYHGGLECTNGTDISYQTCGENPCPIDGEWKEWLEWGNCSTSCGGGFRQRQRLCDGPYYGGDNCTGDDIDTESCSEQECPVDGVWFDWTDWSICNVTCGGGSQFSVRDCDGPYNGGAPCQGQNIRWQMCNQNPCPVDGVWNEWMDWGACDSTCAYGHQMRSRNCTGPYHGGLNCTGEAEDIQSCFAAECPMDGTWMRWSDWTECSLSCGGGSQEKNRACFGPYFGGLQCEGNETEVQSCNGQPCPVDGYYDEWADWQQCNVTCAGGLQQRIRDCIEPLHGGLNCSGDDTEYQTCNENPCPVDGEWSLWSLWSTCNVTCAGGLQHRYRLCTLAAHGGSDCEGDGEEYRECNSQPCPVDGIWMAWSNWTTCSVSCGGGYQDRDRDCDGPYHGGLNCSGPYNETRDCNIQHCPVDGVLTAWSNWTECPVTCGGSFIHRYRDCTGPFYGGLQCVGDLNQTEECNTQHCPINGSYTDWTPWTVCNVTCGTGLQYRSRECNGTAYGGMNCSHLGEPYEDQLCNDFPCPIDGVLTAWSNWTQCTVTCGFGTQDRDRDCDGPYHGGLDCQEPLNETRGCNEYYCPVDGYFTEWTNWTSCSVSCGGGNTTRERDCVGPYHLGLNCTGEWSQTLDCNTHECPIDGVWEQWSDWSACSLSCGGGSQGRQRDCVGPFYGGLECPGNGSESQNCNTHHCPIDGIFMEWTDWSECSLTCGGGINVRSRECDGPFYDGLNCTGDWDESRDCNIFNCPIPGNWTEWSEWSSCSLTCGGGIQTRTRDCDISWIQGLTAPCEGDDSEETACHEFSCDTARTCSEWYDRGLRISGETIIDPDGEFGFVEPFYVYCDMTINGGESIMKHNNMESTLVDGYESKCEYYQEFAYGGLPDFVGLEAAMALVDSSVDCQQFVSWNCVSATINHPSLAGYALTYWMNRDYEERNYIGDFETLSDLDMSYPYDLRGCECSLTGGCGDIDNPDPFALCNCDINDYVNRTDSGLIKYKPDLPISAFCAGDTGATEEMGVYRVGELRCCGTGTF